MLRRRGRSSPLPPLCQGRCRVAGATEGLPVSLASPVQGRCRVAGATEGLHKNKKQPPVHWKPEAVLLAHLAGFEPTAFRLGGGRSILLSYRCMDFSPEGIANIVL